MENKPIQATHFHLVLTPLREDIATVVARFKRRSAGVVLGRRREMCVDVPRSLWTGGKFVTFIFSAAHLMNTVEYVRRHNRRDGLPDDPYDWIRPLPECVPGRVFPDRVFPGQDGRAI